MEVLRNVGAADGAAGPDVGPRLTVEVAGGVANGSLLGPAPGDDARETVACAAAAEGVGLVLPAALFGDDDSAGLRGDSPVAPAGRRVTPDANARARATNPATTRVVRRRRLRGGRMMEAAGARRSVSGRMIDVGSVAAMTGAIAAAATGTFRLPVSAATSSPAVCGRFFGSLARSQPTVLRASFGSRSRFGASRTWRRITSWYVRPSNGTTPVRIS